MAKTYVIKRWPWAQLYSLEVKDAILDITWLLLGLLGTGCHMPEKCPSDVKWQPVIKTLGFGTSGHAPGKKTTPGSYVEAAVGILIRMCPVEIFSKGRKCAGWLSTVVWMEQVCRKEKRLVSLGGDLLRLPNAERGCLRVPPAGTACARELRGGGGHRGGVAEPGSRGWHQAPSAGGRRSGDIRGCALCPSQRCGTLRAPGGSVRAPRSAFPPARRGGPCAAGRGAGRGGGAGAVRGRLQPRPAPGRRWRRRRCLPAGSSSGSSSRRHRRRAAAPRLGGGRWLSGWAGCRGRPAGISRGRQLLRGGWARRRDESRGEVRGVRRPEPQVVSAAGVGRVRGGPGGSALRLPGGPAGRRVPGVPAGPADAARPALGGCRVRSARGRRVPGVPQPETGARGWAET